MDLLTAAGSKVYIAAETTDCTTSGEYDALTWTEIGTVESRGAYGDRSAEVTFTSLGDGRVRKAKGARDAGMMTLVCGRDPDDAGQAALKAAEAASVAYNFKVERNDQITPTTGNPTTEYFKAFVLSFERSEGTQDQVEKINVELSLDTAIITKAAV